ncbi:uncharacterized protein LOC131440580 [Malaya genurostris]|uniref:uncharacterized protein LOC131440580 n=1 Tax=Malaya genurostris TaxID=325434 RepID=UPI0026F37FA9|nr:uncharacterized protein LOC131440580 [Malaya genurostris]
MCSKEHTIQLINVADNDKFTHSLILVKGVIVNRCDQSILKVKINNSDYPASSTVKFINEKRGQFKLLLKLKSGENNLTLIYCNHELELCLFYEETNHNYTVTPLYIICKGHNGHYQSDTEDNGIENACEKITLGVELVQCLYAEKLSEKGFGRKTFTIGCKCYPFYSSLPLTDSKNMTDQELWTYFANEILGSELFLPEKQKFVGFISSTYYEGISGKDFSYETIKRRTTGHAALGGGGFALFGTGCLYTWPRKLIDIIPAFLNTKLVNRELFMDDSNYRYTYGGCFATTIGSVCHEMGHIFDLGHTKDGLMGSGIDLINRVFTLPTMTDILPDRIVSRTGLKRELMNSKLTTIKRPGEFLRKYHQQKESDVTYFSDNCALTLHLNKWFNSNSTTCDNNCDTKLSFNFVTRFITSTHSFIKLVELRDKGNGMLKMFWSFQDTNTVCFKIVEDIPLDGLTLFVIDSFGNILKQDL